MQKLNEIAIIQTGVFMKEANEANAHYFQLNDFNDDGVFRREPKLSIFIDDKTRQHQLNYRDLLLAAKGNNNICITVPHVDYLCVASPSFLVIRITAPSVLAEYVCWYLNLPTTQQKLRGQGTSIMSITKSSLGELKIPIPSLERQRVYAQLAELQKNEKELYKAISEKRSLVLEYKMIKKI